MPTNFQTDLNQYNQVSDDSMLTHQNLLFAQNHFAKDLNFGFSFYDQSQGRESVSSEISEFIRSNKNSLSLIIGNASFQQTPTHNNFSGGSHWTALNLKKLANGSVIAFYADSLQGKTTSIPRIIKDALKKFDIKVYSTSCQQQSGNKCGDCALYNAIAMNKMDRYQIANQTLAIDSMPQANFIQANREVLKRQFNKPVAKPATNEDEYVKKIKLNLSKLRHEISDYAYYEQNLKTNTDQRLEQELKTNLLRIHKQNKNIFKEFSLNLIPFVNEDNHQKISPSTQGLLNQIQDDIVAKKPKEFISLIEKLISNPRLCNDQNFKDEFKRKFIEVKSIASNQQQSFVNRLATRNDRGAIR